VNDSDLSLPPEVRDRSAWYGAEICERTDWVARLSEAEIAEVERAVGELEESRVDLVSITAEGVALPTLAPRLQRLLDEVLNGRGFVLIKGLPVERWTKREAAIAFLIIGVHLGNLRMQNAEGHLLGHVKDLGRSSADPNTRIYQTRERQTHHTDSCDVVGLLCLRAAKSGGLSSLVSSTTIFNEMRHQRPDLLKVLLDPIETDRRGEVPDGSKPYFTIPVFNYHDSLVSAIYQRQYIESARRFPDVPPLTSQQIEAMDLLDQLANDPKLNLMMELEPGDIQLVHNHTILHDRTAFEDFEEPERKRHLLRLWLAPPSARRLPEVYAERFGSITPGDRGGVTIKGSRATIPLV
jgi:Taurine catabolism dioxygenase TauD, TfdA family